MRLDKIRTEKILEFLELVNVAKRCNQCRIKTDGWPNILGDTAGVQVVEDEVGVKDHEVANVEHVGVPEECDQIECQKASEQRITQQQCTSNVICADTKLHDGELNKLLLQLLLRSSCTLSVKRQLAYGFQKAVESMQQGAPVPLFDPAKHTFPIE